MATPSLLALGEMSDTTSFVGRLLASLLVIGFAICCYRRSRRVRADEPPHRLTSDSVRARAKKRVKRITVTDDDGDDDGAAESHGSPSLLWACVPEPCFNTCITALCGIGWCGSAFRCWCRGVRCGLYISVVLMALVLSGFLAQRVREHKDGPSVVEEWQRLYSESRRSSL